MVASYISRVRMRIIGAFANEKEFVLMSYLFSRDFLVQKARLERKESP